MSWISIPVIPPGVPVAAFDQRIGHQLAAGAGVPGAAESVGVPGEGGVDGHALGNGEQGGEVGHGVRSRAEADIPLAGGVRRAVGDGARVQPVRGGAGRGDQPPVADAVQGAGVGGEFRVDGGPVRSGQAGGFAHQEGGAPFVELPGLQCGEGVRHLGHEGLGQAQEPASFGRGFAPGEGDLRADPGAEFLGRDPCGTLLAPLEEIEGNGEPGLLGGHSGFPVFQFPDPVNDPGGVRGRREGGLLTGGGGEGRAAVVCARSGGRTAPGAAEASLAVSCRNHFGPLIAVHESSLVGGSDIKRDSQGRPGCRGDTRMVWSA